MGKKRDVDTQQRRAMSAPTIEVHRPVGKPVPRAPPPPRAASPFDPCVDRYESRGEIGKGGMGRIEDAFDRVLGRSVAIKHMLRGTELDHARFEREARITARLEHPGIVPIHEAGRDPDGTPYYVMRRIDGRPLAELVSGSLADGLALIPNVLTACDAVAFAHAQGIVHRDIKPTNILVGPFGETLVIDWGLAREIDPEAANSGTGLPIVEEALTVAGTIAGTPGFMAPEQARGESVDARADVFALGATLFYVLAGQAPYEGTSATELVSSVGDGRPPDWRALPEGVPADLRAIVVKALASDSGQRYGDAGALAADLRRFVTGNLVDAHEYNTLARLRRFARRHRAALAVVTVSLVVLAIGGTLSFRRIVAERDIAELRRREATDTADQMLVQRAQALALTDPVGAITLLRRLDATSARWRDAWLAAAAAWTRGIPFGFRGDPGVAWLQISADNRRAVSASFSGQVVVYDLVEHTQHAVATLPTVRQCHWMSEHQVLCVYDGNHLAIVDTDQATTHNLDLQAVTVVADRRGRAMVETPDHRIVELSGPDGPSREVATATELAAVSDRGDALMWQGGVLELLTSTGIVPIARFGDEHASHHSLVTIQGDTIAALIGDEIVRWHVTADRVVEDPRWPVHDELEVAIAGGHVYATTGGELRAVDARIHIAITPQWIAQTGRGLVAVGADGSLLLIDDDGVLRLGPFPGHVKRVDLSPDGRILIAVTSIGEVLAWDLGQLRPHVTLFSPTETPILLNSSAVWTRDPGEGLSHHQIGHESTKHVVVPGILGVAGHAWFTVADDGRWAALRDPRTGQITAYDVARDRTAVLSAAVTQAVDVDGLALANPDGALVEWKPGHDRPEEIGRLPSAPRAFSISGRFVVAAFADRKLSRFDLSGGPQRDATFPDLISEVLIAPNGRAWVATNQGGLWRWDPEAEPVQLELSEHIEEIAMTRGRIIARTSRSLLSLDAETPRAVPADAHVAKWMGSNYVASLSARGAIVVTDLETGGSFPLPASAMNDVLVATDDTLMFSVSGISKFSTFELHVPHDPVALQHWLRDITNARQPEGGQGGVWP